MLFPKAVYKLQFVSFFNKKKLTLIVASVFSFMVHPEVARKRYPFLWKFSLVTALLKFQ